MEKLTKEEKDYFDSYYFEAIDDGLKLFKSCSFEALVYIRQMQSGRPVPSSKISRKSLLTDVAIHYARQTLLKEIADMRKPQQKETTQTTKTKFNLDSI